MCRLADRARHPSAQTQVYEIGLAEEDEKDFPEQAGAADQDIA